MNYKNSTYLVKLFTLFAAYFISAKIGLLFGAVNGFATLIWIPSGISLAALLLTDSQLWPAIACGAFLVILTNGANFQTAALISIGNTLEAIVAASTLRRLAFDNSFRHVKDVYFFILVILLGATIAALFGASSLFVNHAITLPLYLPTLGTWWLGDFISMLTITPLLCTWMLGYKDAISSFTYSRFFEAVCLILCVILLSGFIYWEGPSIFRNSPKTYLIFPLLIWTALRFGMKGSTVVTIVIFSIAAIGAILDIGPLASDNLTFRLFLVQGFLIISATTTFILAAVDTERRELDKRKNDFISMASHELKTPLTSTKVLIQMLLKKSAKNTSGINMLGKTNAQIDKLINLVNELLDVTKIVQGKLELKKEVFEIKPFLRNVVEELQLTTDHGLQITEIHDAYLFNDKQRFQQIITNLVINAIKFSSAKSTIIISSVKKNKNLIISIQDFGIGIPKSDQIHVFDRFYQIKKGNRDTYPGLGLGLFIVKEIITRMDGKIWMESTEGKGSTFYVSLPIYKQVK